MANPTFLSNDSSQKVDSIIAPDGTVLRKIAVGQRTGTYTGALAWQGVATHTEGLSYVAGTDGIVVTGGIDETDLVTPRPQLVDAYGHPVVRVLVTLSTMTQTTPTVGGGAYALKDNIGGLLSFGGAARAGVLSGRLEGVMIVDKAQQMSAMDLILFSASITTPTNNTIFDPTDAELEDCIGVIKIVAGDYADFNDNSIAFVKPSLAYFLAGTTIYGVLVSRGTPTYAGSSDIVVGLTVRPD